MQEDLELEPEFQDMSNAEARAIYQYSFTAVEVIMWTMMSYLIEVGCLDLTHAAGVISIWSGSVPILGTSFLLLSTNLTGNLPFVMLGLIASTLGLTIVTFATYTTEPIFLYIGLAFVLVGFACREASLNFITELQLDSNNHELTYKNYNLGDNCNVNNRGLCFARMAIALLLLVFSFAHVFKPWLYHFMFGTALMAFITLLIMMGSWRYSFNKLPRDTIDVEYLPYGSRKYETSDHHHENNYVWERLLSAPRISCVEEGMASRREDETISCRIKKVTKLLVGETEVVLHIVPMCIAIFISGMVSCLGETYFIAQAMPLNMHIGTLKFSLYILLAFEKASQFIFAKTFSKHSPTKGVIAAMVYATLSCITAALVETRRLCLVQVISHGNDSLGKTNDGDQIPMSVFWLVPQFVLLGGFKSAFEMNIEVFIQQKVNDPFFARNATSFAKGVQGLGKFGSVVLVFVLGKMEESYEEAYWLHNSVFSKSHLDMYFWVLASFSTLDIVLFLDVM